MIPSRRAYLGRLVSVFGFPREPPASLTLWTKCDTAGDSHSVEYCPQRQIRPLVRRMSQAIGSCRQSNSVPGPRLPQPIRLLITKPVDPRTYRGGPVGHQETGGEQPPAACSGPSFPRQRTSVIEA
jgi:hypothetical protein